jgi:hypothetical protein
VVSGGSIDGTGGVVAISQNLCDHFSHIDVVSERKPANGLNILLWIID